MRGEIATIDPPSIHRVVLGVGESRVFQRQDNRVLFWVAGDAPDMSLRIGGEGDEQLLVLDLQPPNTPFTLTRELHYSLPGQRLRLSSTGALAAVTVVEVFADETAPLPIHAVMRPITRLPAQDGARLAEEVARAVAPRRKCKPRPPREEVERR